MEAAIADTAGHTKRREIPLRTMLRWCEHRHDSIKQHLRRLGDAKAAARKRGLHAKVRRIEVSIADVKKRKTRLEETLAVLRIRVHVGEYSGAVFTLEDWLAQALAALDLEATDGKLADRKMRLASAQRMRLKMWDTFDHEVITKHEEAIADLEGRMVPFTHAALRRLVEMGVVTVEHGKVIYK